MIVVKLEMGEMFDGNREIPEERNQIITWKMKYATEVPELDDMKNTIYNHIIKATNNNNHVTPTINQLASSSIIDPTPPTSPKHKD